MFRKLGHGLLIVALVFATGGHWALLQTVAWTNMLATHLRSDSLEVAVTKTFDGQHPCKLCNVVAAGKKAEKRSELPTLATKLEFTLFANPFVFASPTQFYLQVEPGSPSDSALRTPPVPPPRSILG
jgi:hypothetical protein